MRLPGFAGQLAPFKDKVYKLNSHLKNIGDRDGLYKALVTEWSVDAVSALPARRLPTRLDAISSESQFTEPVHRMMLLDGL